MKLLFGDCSDHLKDLEDNSIDSIVCDPPYGINILNKDWDRNIPVLQIWQECFRVLKPGGHILAFSSARLYHHQAVMMEQAGFDTFNMLAWVHGNGIPKGKNLSREFDRIQDIPKPDDKFREYLRSAIDKSSYSIVELEKICGTKGLFCHYLGKSQPIYPSLRVWKTLKNSLDFDDTYDDFFIKLQSKREKYRRVKGTEKTTHSFYKNNDYLPRTKLARRWEGWRYGKQSIRPVMEPIYFGQKPPLRPVRKNIEAWETGALNIEGCKQKEADGRIREMSSVLIESNDLIGSKGLSEVENEEIFYCPKPQSKERLGNKHPTLKPIDLMRRLVRLVTPSAGICLDPFMGSGTTGVACLEEGFQFIGIEKERKYFDLARLRVEKSELGLSA